MKYKKRADGRYRAKVLIGTEDGKPKYKYVYATNQRDLEKKISEIKSFVGSGVNVLEADSTLAEWIDRFNSIRKHELTEKNYSTEEFRLNFYVQRIGQLKLKVINQSIIQSLIYELYEQNPTTGKPTAKKTLIGYINSLSRVFEFAIENRATNYNPCKYVKIPKNAPTSERRALSEKEQKWIRETEHQMQTPAMLMLYAGLRRGEACALMWSDIDFKENTIIINKSYDFYMNEMKEPKTKSGYRTIPMPKILSDYLNTLERNSLFVVNNGNKKYSNTMWQYHWDDYMKTLDEKYGMKKINNENKTKKEMFKDLNNCITIKPFTPHCLRHTFCTNCYTAGIPVESCRKLMGHSDIQTTLKVYTHLSDKVQKQSIDKLDDFLSKLG